MANMTVLSYENIVFSVIIINNATATWKPNIFCSTFYIFPYFANGSSFFGFLQVMEIVAYVSVYVH